MEYFPYGEESRKFREDMDAIASTTFGLAASSALPIEVCRLKAFDPIPQEHTLFAKRIFDFRADYTAIANLPASLDINN